MPSSALVNCCAVLAVAFVAATAGCDRSARRDDSTAEHAAAPQRPASAASLPAPAKSPNGPAARPSPDASDAAGGRSTTHPGATGDAPGQRSATGESSASAPSLRKPCRVALIGDSLTDARVGGGGFVRTLKERAPQSQFENFAKGGAMVNQMRRTQLPEVETRPHGTFTHVVVFGGVNDLYSDETAGRTVAKIQADLLAIYRIGKARGARVVAVSVAPWGGFTRYYNPRRAATTRELNRWILESPARGDADLAVDAFTLLACGDPDVICPDYRRAVDDGLHFGKAGHQALAEALFEAEFKHCA